MFKKVSQLLPKKDPFLSAKICYFAQRQGLSPLYFKNKTLTLKAKNQTEAQEILLKEEEIKEKLNEKLGQKIIERIRYKIG